MAKPLTRPQPLSSVAGMLQPGIGAQALSKPAPAHVPVPISEAQPPQPATFVPPPAAKPKLAVPTGEIPNVPRQFTLTASTDRVLRRIVGIYSEAAGMDLKHSELLRAILMAVEHAVPELEREAAVIGKIKRPKNDRGREAEREALERRIAKAFIAGMRAARVLEAQ
jgi:hypothetical protein